ncbi:MAG: class IV adenylate cyclase [archaeon]|nr:class IV adenylate cyclase [archaeon]
MIEVEVKARIESFESMKEKLDNLNAEKVKTEYQEDRYFNSPVVNFVETDEALRIRKTKSEDYENLFITYKGPKLDSKSKTREEVEMKIEDENKCSKIFKNLGFKEVRTVIKNRDYYKIDNFEISLDDIEGLDPYMEIEVVLEDNSDYTKAQENIFKMFEKLGITEGFERTSYLELLENKDKICE